MLTQPGLADGLSPHNGLIRVFHSYSQNSNISLQQMKEESLRSQHKISCWVFQGNFSVSTGRKLADFWCFTWTKVLLMSLPGCKKSNIPADRAVQVLKSQLACFVAKNAILQHQRPLRILQCHLCIRTLLAERCSAALCMQRSWHPSSSLNLRMAALRSGPDVT